MTRLNQVLVVEDSADQAGLLRQYFEKAGCAVQVVGTGEEVGWGKLLLVAGNDELPAAINAVDGVSGQDL